MGKMTTILQKRRLADPLILFGNVVGCKADEVELLNAWQAACP